MISERPAEAEDRATPGHWEGDLIIGIDRSAIGTLVERTSRFTMLLHLPRMEGYGIELRIKSGPALAGYGAVAMRHAITDRITTLPEQLRRSLTWDRGKELRITSSCGSKQASPSTSPIRTALGSAGRHENTNGLLRQYFPKGTDLARWSVAELEAVAATLNGRPRKTLAWKTPAEALNDHLVSISEAGVATTS
jgi:IS30 family transposase